MIFRHIFKTGEPHAKALCLECGYRWFVNRSYLTDDAPIYNRMNFVAQVKEIKKRRHPKAIQIKEQKIKKEVVMGFCKQCLRDYILMPDCHHHKEGFCNRKCLKRNNKKNRNIKKKIRKDFYLSREWMALRYKALLKYGRKCQCCRAIGVEIHVDHIIPRSKRPDLELDINNLQTLCRPCNLGKSNKDQTDFRGI